ncbi:hypothetical protein [Microvirga lotononidis]|nr:hypothetical protein [Microvirga lotononidis]WQO30451.1 hypothetical protein U0023_23640 [Microvirga lotononidis]
MAKRHGKGERARLTFVEPRRSVGRQVEQSTVGHHQEVFARR